MSLTVAAVDIVLVACLVARRLDVRLVLLLGALPLFATSDGLRGFCAKVAGEMANPGTVVPICSALGFAHVLKLTGCDRHLVQLLILPLNRVRALLIPGGIAAGYLVNTTIVSQTGTAAVLGPILIPLLRAGGLCPAGAGAVLLLGSSMGGELFNPGAVEIRKLAELTHARGVDVVNKATPLNLLGCSTALLTFWLLARRGRESGSATVNSDEVHSDPAGRPAADAAVFRIHPVKAIVPLLPVFLLFTDMRLGALSPLRTVEGPAKILLAVLIGIAVAAIVDPRSIPRLAGSFFEGAGYAYTHVISLIVAASTYAEGIRLSGLIEMTVKALVGMPVVALVVSTVVPWFLAVVSGTGIAPAVSIMEFFVPVASSIGLDPMRLGTVAALGAHFGRTMSPAAAVVMISSGLAGAPRRDLIRRVAPPLLVGGAAFLIAAIFRLA